MDNETKAACVEQAEQIVKIANEILREVSAINCPKMYYVYSDRHRSRANRRSLDLSEDLVTLRRMLYDKE